MTQKRALISGAGIAGLSLCAQLLEAGWSVTLVERASALRTGGYKIDVRGVAVEVLERMELFDVARAKALHVGTGTIVNRNGKPIAALPADTVEGRAGNDFEIVRGDLLQILADRAGDRAQWCFGETITKLTETADGVTAAFSKSPAQTFDVVIGADGLHSQVRALTFGEESQFVDHLGAYVAVFSAPEIDIPASTEWMYPVGPGKSLVVYRISTSKPAMVMLLFRADPTPPLPDAKTLKQHLRKTFERGGWITDAVLEQLETAQDLYFDAISQVHMPKWSKGRVVLLGDAAYSATLASGQGTSLALVGAYVLTHALQNTSTHTEAFEAYERNLRDFVTANQNLAKGNLEGMVPKTRATMTFQTLMLRLIPYLPGKNYIVRRVSEPIQKAANALDLAAL